MADLVNARCRKEKKKSAHRPCQCAPVSVPVVDRTKQVGGEGARRWALRAASPARHPDAQRLKAPESNDRRHAKTVAIPPILEPIDPGEMTSSKMQSASLSLLCEA